MNKYLSFTFDDGFINSANRIHYVLYPFHATFYITTGWVRPNNAPIADEYNKEADHGSIKDWKRLAELGHDIGAHTVTHKKASQRGFITECRESKKFIKKIHSGPYSFAYPHHEVYSNPEKLPFDSVRGGPGKEIYNDLKTLDKKNLVSWDRVWECDQTDFDKVPDNSWVIIALHGIDEGWMPIIEKDLVELLILSMNSGFQVLSVGEVLAQWNTLF